MIISTQKKQVVILYSSTLIGVLLGVLASIINTRFLSTIDYGNVRYVQNVINFIASLLLFGYFLSGSRLLALSKEESYSRRIRGSLIVILAIASLLLVIGLIVCYFINLQSKPIISTLFLVSLPVCFYPLFNNYISTVLQGDNHITKIAISRFLPMLIYIPLGYYIYNSMGATSSLMILLQWGCYSLVFLLIILSTHPDYKNLRPIFVELNRENKEYGFQLYIGSLVMVATNYLAGITLGLFNQDNSEVGFYTLAMTVTSPLAMFPAIIGTTYFKQFASLNKIPNKVMVFTSALTLISCALFIVLIKPIVILFYTDKYAVVGDYAIWLAIGYSIHGFGDMINRYLGSHGQGASIRNSSIANGLFKVFGFTVLVYFFNTHGALITNILCSLIYFSLLLFYYIKFVKANNE